MAKKTSTRATSAEQKPAAEADTVKKEEAETKPEAAPAQETKAEEKKPADAAEAETDDGTDETSEVNQKTIARIANIRDVDFRMHRIRDLAAQIYIAKTSTLNAAKFNAKHHIGLAWEEAEAFVDFADAKAAEEAE